MPVVHVNMWKGIDQKKIEYLIQNITKVFVDMGVPADAVSVIIHEIPKEHWGEGGETCAVRFKDIEP
jgi:4-oxalocrotonate tautomerase